MSIGIIAWEDPEPTAMTRRRQATLRTKADKVAEELKAHPGKWAKIGVNSPTNLGTRLKEVHGIEVTTRVAGRGYKPGRADVYARYPVKQV